MQDMREIPAIVNEEIVIKCFNFHTFGGGTSLVMALARVGSFIQGVFSA